MIFVKNMEFFFLLFCDKMKLLKRFGEIVVKKKGFLIFRDTNFKSRHFSDPRNEVDL